MGYTSAAHMTVDRRTFLLVMCAVAGACRSETPPAPQEQPNVASSEAASEVRFDPKASTAVLTFAGERGVFKDGSSVEDVPEAAQGLVRVTMIGAEPPPPNQVWVANLHEPEPDGSFLLKPVPRDLFEELALGQGLASAVQLPPGLEPPPQVKALAPGEVIVYKTSWCGVCKKLESYLKRNNIPYVAKDIEKDRAAAAELQAKAQQKGLPLGSVPVVDVGGEMMVGFDRARLEHMLKS